MSDTGDEGSKPPYHWLTVDARNRETADAHHFVLVPEPGEVALFRYVPGQFLTFRIPHPDGTILRSYSLSSAPCTDPDLAVCVKRVTGGRGSNWMNDHLRDGDRIAASRPAGRFVLSDTDAPLLFIAGGSGITPCLSLIKQALFATGRSVRLIYANRDAASVIYRADLDKLTVRFQNRFDCRHWLDDRHGLMTRADIADVVGAEVPDCYICGPALMMDMAEETLRELLGDGATILTEQFVSPDDPGDAENPEPQPSRDRLLPASFRLTLDGADHTVPLSPNQTLLQAALSAGIDAPSSCTEGHCGACMAQLREGKVAMASTKALSKRNLERGHVLACQSRPVSAEPIWLDFDF